MGGRFVGKPGDLGDDTVTPRENTQSLTNPHQTLTGTNILPTQAPLQHSTMIQIQNNMPVMSSTVQHSAVTVSSI